MKYAFKRIKRQTTHWKKIFAKHMSHKVLISEIQQRTPDPQQ